MIGVCRSRAGKTTTESKTGRIDQWLDGETQRPTIRKIDWNMCIQRPCREDKSRRLPALVWLCKPLCPFVFLSLCLCVLFIDLSLSACPSVCLSVCVSLSLRVSPLSVCLPLCLSAPMMSISRCSTIRPFLYIYFLNGKCLLLSVCLCFYGTASRFLCL